MHFNNSLLLSSFFLCLLSSCSIINQGSGYDASPVFAPTHSKSGELKTGIGYGGILGASGNVSYSFTNHLAIMAGGVYNHQNKRTLEAGFFSSKYFRLRNHYLEGALGYFTPIKTGSFTNLEIYAGMGKGITNKESSFNKDFSGSYSEAIGRYFKTFLQVSLKVAGTAPKLDLVFANRISHLYYYDLNFNESYSSDTYTDSFDKARTLLTEPVIIISYGKKLKGTGQIGLAFPLSGGRLENYRSSYTNASSIFQLGMLYHLK